MTRPTGSHSRVVLLVAVLVCLAIVPAPAVAEPRAGGSVVVEAGETTGDLEAYGGDVAIRGTVDGDLQVFAGNVRILGEVTGDVETASGNVVISGTVGGDVSASGGAVQLTENATVGGTFEAGAGSVLIDGRVGGPARVGAGDIVLGPTASIGGDLEYDGNLTRSSGATVGGEVVNNPDLEIGDPLPSIPGFVFGVYVFLVNLVVGAVLLLVFPRFTRGMAERTVERPARTGAVGLLALVGTPILLVLLAITIVGIPLALAGAIVYGLAVWLGVVLGRYVLGAWLLSFVDVDNRWAALMLGTVVMVPVTRIPILGGLLDLVVLLLGLGALAYGLYRGYRARRRGRSSNAATAAESTESAA